MPEPRGPARRPHSLEAPIAMIDLELTEEHRLLEQVDARAFGPVAPPTRLLPTLRRLAMRDAKGRHADPPVANV